MCCNSPSLTIPHLLASRTDRLVCDPDFEMESLKIISNGRRRRFELEECQKKSIRISRLLGHYPSGL
ncbi:hypothetical protein BJX65DRAFT_273168 [Aspergillus insuetus]